MAAMVAPQQHQPLWQQPQRHMNSLPMTSMHPSTSAPATSNRNYQQNHVEISMPFLPPTSLPQPMPFQGAYGFDLTAMNHHYSVQPPQQAQFAMNFSQQPSVQQQHQPPTSYP